MVVVWHSGNVVGWVRLDVFLIGVPALLEPVVVSWLGSKEWRCVFFSSSIIHNAVIVQAVIVLMQQ